jgi:tRNA pseudouridine32 synthase/23S rRNA pseudouridine746 synthase
MMCAPASAVAEHWMPLHEDEHLLVLNKPSGLLSVPGRGPDKQDCLSRRVQAIYPEALVVHRLDQDTSGLLLMARGLESQRQMSRLFETRQVHKRYLAVVAGQVGQSQQTVPADEEGWRTIDGPILLDWERRPLHIVHPDGKASRSRWRAVQSSHSATLVELEPVTGRTHQLRVHLHSIGHPILGDALYAPEAVRQACPRLMLHAHALAFTHPFTGLSLAFSTPVHWSAEPPYGPFTQAPKMTFEAFQAQALAEGFDEVLEKVWAPHTVLAEHTHPFAVKVRVAAGQLWLSGRGVNGQLQKRYLSAGDAFTLPRSEPHAEHYGPEGATFWVARKN